MRIKDVEAIVGVTKKNIRFYEDAGLLSPGRNAENSYREYTMEDVERLRRIKLLRRLDMPVSDIRELLCGALPLPVAARRHDLALEARMDSLQQARALCRELAQGGGLDTLDAQALLERLENMEKGGVRFLDVEKKDVRRKYTGAVIACAVFVLLIAGVMAFLITLARSVALPWWVLGIMLLFLSASATGCIAALISRIKEIQGGEENDLGNY